MARVGVFLLLCCTVLQHTYASPRPEFGSIGTVQSSNTIKTTVESITPLLEALDDKNGLTLKTDLPLLIKVLPLMETLGTQVTTLGPSITIGISDGVPKADGNYDGVFNPIVSSIGNFKTFIDTTVSTTRATLKADLGNDIDVLFGDGFGNMRNALVMLENALLRLKGALKTAPVKNGRASVDPNIIVSVVVAVAFFKATVSPVEYIVYSTIENVGLADDFLHDLENMSTGLKNDLQQYVNDFEIELKSDGTLITTETDKVKTQYDAVATKLPDVTPSLTTQPDYTDTGSALQTFDNAFGTLPGLVSKVAQGVTEYMNGANAYLATYTDVLVPRSYAAVTYVIEVLIAGGANSRFCFFKHSPLLVNYYAQLVSDVELCFNVEGYRLSLLAEVAASIGKVALFDVEDLIDNLTACKNMKPTPNACLKAIGPYYKALAAKTTAKIGAILKIGLAEGKASLQRLGSCILAYRLKNQQELISSVDAVKECHEKGPQMPTITG